MADSKGSDDGRPDMVNRDPNKLNDNLMVRVMMKAIYSNNNIIL